MVWQMVIGGKMWIKIGEKAIFVHLLPLYAENQGGDTDRHSSIQHLFGNKVSQLG